MDMITRPIGRDAAPARQASPVNSHNEWDPLEEIIVGRLEGATIPSDHPVVTCNIPGVAAWAQSLVAGFRYPKIMIEPAQRELDGFVALLQSLGIVVTRPEPVEHKKRSRSRRLRRADALHGLGQVTKADCRCPRLLF